MAGRSHSDFDGYCEIVWEKQKYDMSKADFTAWAHMQQGRADLLHYTKFLVELKQKAGHKGRISAKMWSGCPTPAKVDRETIRQKELVEPDEIFLTESKFEARFGVLPSTLGHVCVWETRSNGKAEYGCWVANDDEPLRRRNKWIENVKLTEQLDNSDEALTADQLGKRFKAESKALSASQGASAALADAASAASALQQRKAEIAPSSDAAKVGVSLLAPEPVTGNTGSKSPCSKRKASDSDIAASSPAAKKATTLAVTSPSGSSIASLASPDKGRTGVGQGSASLVGLGLGGAPLGGRASGGGKTGKTRKTQATVSSAQMSESKLQADQTIEKFRHAATVHDINDCKKALTKWSRT